MLGHYGEVLLDAPQNALQQGQAMVVGAPPLPDVLALHDLH